ncbi:TraB/GumN family protein [Chelativorans sp.]|uniref:TraB/GumN family protein n=1 Tax=Chelativorans sp. TaxID=2203393 RepID=UPI0028110D8B|nr:TraB/GumN family protein [Chelativorans sp.]
MERTESATNLSLTAAANLLFAMALLLLAGAQAQAEEPIACEGANLVAQLATEDPALLREIENEAAATPNGEGLLWRIEADGAAPSYLFGTMHVTDPRVTRLPGQAQEAFDLASTVAIETTQILDEAAMMAAVFEKPGLMMFSQGESLTDHLTPDQRKIVEEEFEERGAPFDGISKMKPWILVSLVSMPDCELKRQQAGAIILDAKLAKEAKAAGKKVAGLETVAEQLSAMASLPMELHVRGLVGAIELGDRMDDMIETMVALYLDGRTGMFRPALGKLLPMGEGEAADYSAFEQRMIDARNHVMAERSQKLIEEGGAFIAVGAMHLPGPNGLVELLRKAGYRLSRAERS